MKVLRLVTRLDLSSSVMPSVPSQMCHSGTDSPSVQALARVSAAAVPRLMLVLYH